MQVTASDVDTVMTEEKGRFGKRNRSLLDRVDERPNCFVAITTAAPGVDTFKGIKWKETRTIITGPVIQP